MIEQLGDISPAGSVVIGIIVGLASTSVQSLGLTLQRKSHILEEEKEFQDARRPPYRRRRWQVGMFIFILSNVIGSSIQITTLPLPVLSTLQASGLVFNSICATLILGEPFTRYSLAGTLLVFAGAVLIATFGAIGEPAHALDQLLALLARPQFLGWMAFQALLVAGILLGARALPFFTRRGAAPHHSPRLRLLQGMAYGSVSGILSALLLLVAKSAVELLVRTVVDGKNQFDRAPSWLILLGLVALALCQLYFLHRGLKLCSTSVLYPFVFCIYNVLAILDGLIYFRQASRLSTLSAVLIALGTVILLAGVICLSWRLNDDAASRAPVAQTPLTPGLGLVPDSPSESSTPALSDEEAHLLPPAARHPRRIVTLPAKLQPYARRPPATAPARAYGATDAVPSSPGSRSSARARTPATAAAPRPSRYERRRRARTMAEADAIWGELEEDAAPSLTSPLVSPDPRRRRSSHSLGHRRPHFTTRPWVASPAGDDGPADEVIADEGADGEAVPADEDADGEAAQLLAPLARSGTGRTYRETRRWSRRSQGGGESGTGRVRSGSQEATGGWWKMRRWWRRGGE